MSYILFFISFLASLATQEVQCSWHKTLAKSIDTACTLGVASMSAFGGIWLTVQGLHFIHELQQRAAAKTG